MTVKFLNFDLELSGYDKPNPNDVVFYVRVSNAPKGRAQEEGDRVTVQGGFNPVLNIITKRYEVDEVTLAGACMKLGDWLFPKRSKVLEILTACKGELGTQQLLVIRLRCKNDELAVIPWEFAMLVDEKKFDGQLHMDRTIAANKKFCFIRFEELTEPVTEVREYREPHIFFVCAQPSGSEPLGLSIEGDKIKAALYKNQSPSPNSFVWEQHATYEKLNVALRPQNIDVFQFSGHGGIDEKKQSYLQLEDKHGEGKALYADQLAMLLAGGGISLAVLAACNTATIESDFPWSGVARKLVENNIPAVVGMQQPIYDNCCIEFLCSFYSALADHLSIQNAMIEGRQAICADKKLVRDFGIPVLYLRQDENWDGIIFPAAPTDQPNDNFSKNIGAAATAYKQLHDILQSTKIGDFFFLAEFSFKFPPNDLAERQKLDHCKRSLKNCASKIDLIVRKGRCDKALVNPIRDLFNEAFASFEAALTDLNKEAFEVSIERFQSLFGRELSNLELLLKENINALSPQGTLRELSDQHHMGQRLEDLLDQFDQPKFDRKRASRRWAEVTKFLGDFIQGLGEDSRESLQQRCASVLDRLIDTETGEADANLEFIGFRSELSFSFYSVDIKLKDTLEARYAFPFR